MALSSVKVKERVREREREKDGHMRLRFGAAGDAVVCRSVAVRFSHHYLTTVADHVHCAAANRELRAGPVGDMRGAGCRGYGVQIV